jgi:hypothetical protein
MGYLSEKEDIPNLYYLDPITLNIAFVLWQSLIDFSPYFYTDNKAVVVCQQENP